MWGGANSMDACAREGKHKIKRATLSSWLVALRTYMPKGFGTASAPYRVNVLFPRATYTTYRRCYGTVSRCM